jgi:tRNA(Ile)-lysidine synthase
MYLLCRLLESGYTVHAAHYNHNLRPTADRDENFVRDWCQSHQIPLAVGGGDVAAFAAERGMGIEEAARELRYEFLQKAAAELSCDLIATGHHAGDNAETVLMNLIRGCGLNGLSGIPERRGNIVRPMLGITRQEIGEYLAAHNIPHVEDETNADPSYTRNRIRSQLIPLLEELNPRAVSHISSAARRVEEDERELQRQAELLLDSCVEREEGCSIPVSVLNNAPRPVALRAVKSLTTGAMSVHLEQILLLCEGKDPSAQIDIPGGRVCRVYDDLLFTTDDMPIPDAVPLHEGTQRWGRWEITCLPALCPPKAYVDRTEFYLRDEVYAIRSRREGDELRLGKRPLKTLKKLMVEERVPRHLRKFVPVLENHAGTAAAAGGFGPHCEFLAQPGTQCLKIIIRKGE